MVTAIAFGVVGLGMVGAAIGLNWSKIKAMFDDKKIVSKDTAVVCVGMENSKVAGSCPGAGLDAQNMYKLLKQYANGGITLLHSNQATYGAVVAALTNALKHDLCIFFYSGHGGRDERDNKNASGETDNRNEYLCFYDKFMVDDAVWNLILQAKGRVVCIFDCCHSGTMYRAFDAATKESVFYGDHPFTFRRFKEAIESKRRRLEDRMPDGYMLSMSFDEVTEIVRKESEELARKTPNMLCWSAAREFEYSYGSTIGGIFTNFLLAAYGKGRTYSEVWSKLVKKMKGQPNEPVRTQFGEGFAGKVFT